MMYPAVVLLSVVLVLVPLSESFQHFRTRIPNGQFVVHPCFEANVLWYGVGHKNPLGGGERNKFGEDFAAQGFRWTTCLCDMDSDGDGMTNGYELGDPNCVWSEGKEPERKTSITHPGVCTPMNTTECEGNWEFVTCSDPSVFDCPATEAAGVEVHTLQFPRTWVPTDATTYKCMAFELPQDGDYHLIASAPTIDEDVVMHHIVLYGCRGTDQETSALSTYATPQDCGMTECNEYITGWTLGIQGSCLKDHYGLKIGTDGYKVAVMEFHWNNPEGKDELYDASALNLYYTPTLRPNNAGNLFIGPALLMIPPGFNEYDVVGTCSADCLSSIHSEPWYIAEVLPHMHYLGSGFKLELIHDGEATVIFEQLQYFYDDPGAYQFENDVMVVPGDEIRVTCKFSSKSRESYTYFGEATQEEMCFAIILFYNSVVMDNSFCQMSNGYGSCPSGEDYDITDDCDYPNFEEVVGQNYIGISAFCDGEGKTCQSSCPQYIDPVKSTSCMQSNTRDVVMAGLVYFDQNFAQQMASCDEKPPVVAGDDDTISEEICPSAGSVKYGAFGMLVLILQVCVNML